MRFLTGLVLGSLLILLIEGLLILRNNQSPQVTKFSPQTITTSAAGIGVNLATHVEPDERVRFTLAASDSGSTPLSVAPTELTSLEVTIAKAEVLLETPLATVELPTDWENNQWEVLNITQPTIELFGLRGSGAVTELGMTELAPGTYRTLRLTLQGIKARRANGQMIDVTVDPVDQVLELNREFIWNTPGSYVQLVLDIDGLRSLAIKPDTHFVPIITRLLQDDQVL